MSFQSLHRKITQLLIWVGLSCFLLVAVLTSFFEYHEVRDEKAKMMLARVEVAHAIVVDTLLSTDDMVTWLQWKINADFNETIFSELASSRYFELQGDSFYILDPEGRVILISEPYDGYYGLDFSAMIAPVAGQNIQVVHQQSILTGEPVVTLQYPIEDGDLLVVERNLTNIIPQMVNFAAGEFFAGELFFVLAKDGKAMYHPDLSLVKSRHNIGFDLKDQTEAATDGLLSFNYHETPYLAVSVNFESPEGWQIYYAIPQMIFQEEIEKALIQQLCLLFFAFLVIFFTLRYFMARFIAQPISAIVGALTKDKVVDEFLVPRHFAGEVKEFGTIITAINVRDQQLSQTLVRFQSMFDGLDSLVYVADMQSHELLFLNKFGKEIFGNGVGQKCYETLQSGQNKPCDFCTNSYLLDEQGEPVDVYVWEFENTVDGEWYECRDQAILWADGRLVRMEIATNITARKQWQSTLMQEKERLAVTLRSIGDGVITVDVNGRVVLVNRVAEELTGWSQIDAVGEQVTDVFNIVIQNTEQQCPDLVQQIYKKGEALPFESEIELVARDGNRRVISNSGAPIRDQDSKIIGAVLVFRDITAELKQEEELHRARKLESLGVLAGGIAHDFNNLLAAILGNLSLAQSYVEASDKVFGLLQQAEKASQRATRLTQQLLTFSKGGSPVKKISPIDKLIRDSADFVLSGSNVSCVYEFSDDLRMVNVDGGQIGQVVQNLVINAKQAMPHGGVLHVGGVNVSEGDLPEGLAYGTYVKMSVRDEGEGISLSLMNSIFDPYFTTKGDGSGLGLAVCHSIIQKHGGLIQVSSEPNMGAEFTIYLPSVFGSQPINDAAVEVEPLKGGRIIVMDDDALVRKMTVGMLKFLGYETFEASDGEETIELVKKYDGTSTTIDAIIMDLTIPGGMGGEEAVTKVLEIDQNLQVIVASGYSNDPILAHCEQYGFVAALVKPYSLEELTAVMTQVFS